MYDIFPTHADPEPEPEPIIAATKHYRALFLSDFHLGAIGCKASRLLDFIRRHDADVTYLVGDIFDTWRPLGAHWTDDQEQILKLLLKRAQTGRRIIYLPGNHDEFFGRYLGRYFADLEIAAETWHITRTGERLLVTHGDGCDVFARSLPLLSRAGGWIEALARRMDRGVRRMSCATGGEEWCGIEEGINWINRNIRAHDPFEERLSALAKSRGADGIVCGHFHKPSLNRDNGVLYANCGDWVENCTALAEHENGDLTLIGHVPEQTAQVHVQEDLALAPKSS